MFKLCVVLFLALTNSFCVFAQNTNNHPLSLATINIRVPSSKDKENNWDNRKELMATYFQQKKLDIICMQEVSMRQLKYLSKVLVEYGHVGEEALPVKGEEYVPIFYKRNKYVCIGNGTFWLSETPYNPGSKGWDAKHVRRLSWVKLKDKKSGITFIVANTHLDHVGKIARLNGMKLIKKKLKRLASENPVILCGDMNCRAISRTYYAALNDEFTMYNSYQIAKVRNGVTYTYHAYGNKLPVDSRNMIDFIFVTSQIAIDSVDIPKEEHIKGVYISDHCPVMTEISF